MNSNNNGQKAVNNLILYFAVSIFAPFKALVKNIAL
ncbi:MAG: hypothetical protein ACJATI_002056 [Halioglobus sp.]